MYFENITRKKGQNKKQSPKVSSVVLARELGPKALSLFPGFYNAFPFPPQFLLLVRPHFSRSELRFGARGSHSRAGNISAENERNIAYSSLVSSQIFGWLAPTCVYIHSRRKSCFSNLGYARCFVGMKHKERPRSG